MNKMFKRIEKELRRQGKTKVWLADRLNESTQNINNWKTRGVPAAKVKKLAEVLGVSREYLEGDRAAASQDAIAAPAGDYQLERDKDGWKINFVVFVEPGDQRIEDLLRDQLKMHDELTYLFCTSWKFADPFLEIYLWLGAEQRPARVYLPGNRVVGITDYSSELHPNLPLS